jgi:GT2 family glycosyltransferase
MMVQPEIDVFVVNYLTPELAAVAVDKVCGPGVQVQVYDNSGDYVAGAGEAGVHTPDQNDYFAHGNNFWWTRTSAPYVLLLNPDVELSYADLLRLRQILDERPELWGVAPRLVYPDGRQQNYLQRLPTPAAALADRFGPARRIFRRAYADFFCAGLDLGQEQVAEQPPAACLLLRRSAVGEHLFDEAYRLYFNDTDLARRLNRNGHCLYTPAITAVHHKSASLDRADAARPYTVVREYDRSFARYARQQGTPAWLALSVLFRLRAAMGSVLVAVNSS